MAFKDHKKVRMLMVVAFIAIKVIAGCYGCMSSNAGTKGSSFILFISCPVALNLLVKVNYLINTNLSQVKEMYLII